jgi:hypothetical protein
MVSHVSPVSKSTVSTLETLLDQAKEGQLVGIAFIGILRSRQPINGFAGYAGQDPYFAMGAMDGLHEMLSNQAKRKYSKHF